MLDRKSSLGFKQGFTIIEIMVAIAILLLLLGVVTSGFQSYQKHQWYQVVVNDVRNGLNQARVETMGSIGGQVYGVYVGTTTVEFFSGAVPIVGNVNNNIIPFSRGIYATSSLADGSWYLTFSRLTGTPSTVGTIEIVDSVTGETTTLSILETGVIQ